MVQGMGRTGMGRTGMGIAYFEEIIAYLEEILFIYPSSL